MGRYYRFSKKVTDEQVKLIEKEMRQLEDVESVEVTKDHTFLKVVTKDDQFAEVMSKAVNICNRHANGTEISFARFATA
ncbi:MAG: hypothetical protein PHN80_16940 [Hespellia sp.]|nr:hypothetical protein [Hespellia stercorisuis]MDD2981626.1 hypothetical protein [Hespellia sp.]